MTVIIDLALHRRIRILKKARDAMRVGVVHLDPMATWHSPLMLSVTTLSEPVKITIGIVEYPCDTEPA